MPRKKKTDIESIMVRDKRVKPLVNAKGSETLVYDKLSEKAMELRLQHKTYATIGTELGISRKQAFEMVHHRHTTLLASLTEAAQHIRAEQNEAYDAIIERWMPLALTEDLNIGEIRQRRNGEEYDASLSAWEASVAATDRVLKALDGKAKINGLNMLKLEVKADPLLTQALYSKIDELARSLKDKRADAIEV